MRRITVVGAVLGALVAVAVAIGVRAVRSDGPPPVAITHTVTVPPGGTTADSSTRSVTPSSRSVSPSSSSVATPTPKVTPLLTVTVAAVHPDATAAARQLFIHGESINRRAFANAWAIFTPRLQQSVGGLSEWESGLQSSKWRELDVVDVTRSGNVLTVDTLLWTTQRAKDGPQGQTCSAWQITYTMVLRHGRWLIDSAKSAGNPQAC